MAWYGWIYNCIRNKYFSFGGRACRSEYWYFVLLTAILNIQFDISVHISGVGQYISGITLILLVFLIIPALAVTSRRLHDTGKSSGWLLINLIPIAGTLVFLYFVIQDSQQDTNKYGPNPKALTN